MGKAVSPWLGQQRGPGDYSDDPKLWDRFTGISTKGRTVGLQWMRPVDGEPFDYTRGMNWQEFHYCPRGPWSDWVELAHMILAEDVRRKKALAPKPAATREGKQREAMRQPTEPNLENGES